MNKTAYQNAIAFFTTARQLEPTPSVLAQLCPHLTAGEIKIIIRKAKLQKRGYYFALPPLLVDDMVTVASIDPAGSSKGKRYPATINFAFADEVDLKSVAYSKRALAYARRHWGDTLVTSKGKSYVSLVIQDPTKLNERGYPTTVTEVHFVTGRDWNDLNNDQSAPHSQLVNDSILHITSLKSVGAELQGRRGGFTDYCCAHCGGGLSLAGCTACNNRFKDNHFRCGWETPLPAKIVDYLVQHGHRFAVDPAIARTLEAARRDAREAEYEKDMARVEIRELRLRLDAATQAATLAAGLEEIATATIEATTAELVRADENARLIRQQVAERRKLSDRELARQRKEAKVSKKTKGKKAKHIPNPGH